MQLLREIDEAAGQADADDAVVAGVLDRFAAAHGKVIPGFYFRPPIRSRNNTPMPP